MNIADSERDTLLTQYAGERSEVAEKWELLRLAVAENNTIRTARMTDHLYHALVRHNVLPWAARILAKHARDTAPRERTH